MLLWQWWSAAVVLTVQAADNVCLQYHARLHIWRIALQHVTITSAGNSDPSMVCIIAASMRGRLQLTCSQTWQLGDEHQLLPGGCTLTAPLPPPGESKPASAHQVIWPVSTGAGGLCRIAVLQRCRGPSMAWC